MNLIKPREDDGTPIHSKRPLREQEIPVKQVTMAPNTREQKPKASELGSEAHAAGKQAMMSPGSWVTFATD